MTDEYAIELIRRAKKMFFDFDKVQEAFDRAIELLEREVSHESNSHNSDHLCDSCDDLLDQQG